MSHTHVPCEDPLDQVSLSNLPSEIRFDPVACPPEAIAAANARERRTGARRFEPTEVAINRIRTMHSPSANRLDSWIRHPDERVPIALLESQFVIPSTKEARFVVPRVIRRAVEEAQSRGEVWTPLLEQVSSSIWESFHWSSYLRPEIEPQPYLDAAIGPWIERQENSDALRYIVHRTRSQGLIRYIAKTARSVDRALQDSVLEACPSAVVDLASNDHLSHELRETLLDWLVYTVASDADLLLEAHKFAPTIHQLARYGVYLRSDHIDHLIHAFDERIHQTDALSRYLCVLSIVLLEQHVRAAGDEEIALRVFEMAWQMNNPSRIWDLIYSSNLSHARLKMTPRLACAAVMHYCGSLPVLQAVMSNPELRKDCYVRRQLLESREPSILNDLAQDARPEEFPIIFKYWASKDPLFAVTLLNRYRELARRTLAPDDLLPLLQSSVQKVRLEAFTLLGEIQNNSETVAPATQQRSL